MNCVWDVGTRWVPIRMMAVQAFLILRHRFSNIHKF